MPRVPKPGDAGDTPLTEDELREQPMNELRDEAAERELVVDGSGKDGAIVKEDLVEAIAEADAIFDDGRPPLHEVAEAAAKRDASSALDLREPSDQ